MDASYKMIGGDGREYGPVSLQEITSWIREGRLAAGSQVMRMDEGVWRAASSFPELGVGTPVLAPAPAVLSPAATAPGPAGLAQLAARFKSGAGWFYWIAGLSVLNSASALFGWGVGFVVGLGITQIIDHVARRAGSSAMMVAGVLDVLAAGLFVLFGLLASKGHAWSFVLGMILYALDGLILLLAPDWLSLGFHVFVLYCIFNGYRALRRLQAAG